MGAKLSIYKRKRRKKREWMEGRKEGAKRILGVDMKSDPWDGRKKPLYSFGE